MLKGNHNFSKDKPQEATILAVDTSEPSLDVTHDTTSEVLSLPKVSEPVSGEAEDSQDSSRIDSVSVASADDTADSSNRTVDSQTGDSEHLSEKLQDEFEPIASENPDSIYPQEQTGNSTYIEDRAELLGDLLSFCFMSEKKPNNGEDSDPLLFLNPKFSAVGVFDGMGGAGSAIHIVGDLEKTGAYLASRKTKDSIESLFDSVCKREATEIDSLNYDEEFKSAIIQSLNNLKIECPPKMKSGLKSAMIKEFPTTLAITTLRKRHNIYLLDSYWAGDSRNYILSPKGLFQTSVDDLEKKSDPYENLYSDSPLSNQICIDRFFRINHFELKPETSKFAIISATDGCFGYYPTPMHFEEALLRNLLDANNIEEWKDALKKEFADTAADDTSFSCIINGFDSFDLFKTEMMGRFDVIHYFIDDYNAKVRELTDLKQRLDEEETAFKEYKQGQWDKYKIDYMSFLDKSDRND